MSSTTRSTLPGSSPAGSDSTRSPTVSVQAGWLALGAPKNWLTLRRATSANSSRRSNDDTLPGGPDRTQQRAAQRTGAGAGLDDAGAGEDVGHRHDLRGVLGVDDRGAARHRDHELAEQRAEDEVLAAGGRGQREALVAADDVVVGEPAAVGVEGLPRLQADVVPPALGVGEADPLPGLERPAAYAGPVGRSRRRHWSLAAPSSKARSTSAVASTPKMVPSASTRTYSSAGVPDMARTRSSPAMSAPQHQAVLDGAGDRADRHPGAAVLRGREQGGLVDDAAEPVVAGVHDDRPGTGLLRAAYGLGDRAARRARR